MKKNFEFSTIHSITKRAHYLFNQMIYMANHRDDIEKGDPKVGGHSSASSSALHILGTLHLLVKTGFDHIANKPHASPADHSFNYLLRLFLKENKDRFSDEEASVAMKGLRAFSQNKEPVFQSYHSVYDSDFHNFLPSGTVGIPPVNLGYLALAYRMAKSQNFKVPEAHFWAVMGDAEFREGSLLEAAPDFAERALGELTWILDYNRQGLDGHRISYQDAFEGNDCDRVFRTMKANGWHVIDLRHGRFREKLFQEKKDGAQFKIFLEKALSDYELQALLLLEDKKELKKQISQSHPNLKIFLKDISDEDLYQGLRDFGGHDMDCLYEAFLETKKEKNKPSFVICHTLKGWGLKMAAHQANHSALPDEKELSHLRKLTGLKEKETFKHFDNSSQEGKFLEKRSQQLYKEILEQGKIKEENSQKINQKIASQIPDSLNINLKMVSYPHTQWMLGQITAKLSRISDSQLSDLKPEEKAFHAISSLFVQMSPDVATSTNLNPAFDGKIFSQEVEEFEEKLGVRDAKSPNLVPKEDLSHRFLRFDITEASTTSCLGSFGKIKSILGVQFFPLMTVYDFFVKRALDQHFYNLYWGSEFLLCGTPSGITLAPEGAQHGWKSNFEIPNQITWEPFYCQEMDWIFCDTLKRYFQQNNKTRTGVHIRCVTRGADQKSLMKNLKTQKKFKQHFEGLLSVKAMSTNKRGVVEENQVSSLDETEILNSLKQDVLKGAYYLRDYRGYVDYSPGDNVVHIFSMGSPTTEALQASDLLLQKGIYGNVIVVTSHDLLIGNLGLENEYSHLRTGLEIDGNLYLRQASQEGDWAVLAGGRIPIVSVHDGEPGLLDNIGSLVGVKHKALAVRKHSKCGRPSEVYKFHGIDSESIAEAAGQVLAETAVEDVKVKPSLLDKASSSYKARDLWKSIKK